MSKGLSMKWANNAILVIEGDVDALERVRNICQEMLDHGLTGHGFSVSATDDQCFEKRLGYWDGHGASSLHSMELTEVETGKVVTTKLCRSMEVDDHHGHLFAWANAVHLPETNNAPVAEPETPIEGKVSFSMNGFRKQLSGDVAALRDIAKAVLNCEFIDHEELRTAVNDVISKSNVLNCVFERDDPEFSDLSHIEVEPLGDRGGDNG